MKTADQTRQPFIRSALIALVLLELLLLPAQAQTQILFSARPTSGVTNHELYTIGVNGANLVRLTTNAYDKISPAVSPDNQTIAFVRNDLAGTNIQIMSINGGAAYTVPVTNHAFYLQWADNQTLYYYSDSGGQYQYRIWKTATNGTGNALVFTNSVSSYPLSWYGFYLNRSNGVVYVPNFDTNGSSCIYYGTNTRNSITNILAFDINDTGDQYAPSLSPDGKNIVICADNGSGNHSLRVASSAGGPVTTLSSSLYAGNPAWLDTNYLVFTKAALSTYGNTYYEGDLFSIKKDGSGVYTNITGLTSVALRCAFACPYTVTYPPPVIALTAPTNNAQFTAPTNLALTSTITTNNHTLSQVRYYANSTNQVGLATNGTGFSVIWSNVPPGTYQLTAAVQYESGSVTSAPVTGLRVLGGLNFTNALRMPGGKFALTFAGPVGQLYSVRSTNTLTAPLATWPVVGTGTIGAGGTVNFTNPSATPTNRLFFRISSP